MSLAHAEINEDLECRLTRKIRVFGENEFATDSSLHFEWLVCSSKFGIGLAVIPNNRLVSYQTSSVHSLPKSSEAGEPEILDLPSRKIDYFQHNVRISLVRLSCNERVVAFGVDTMNGPFVHVFDIFAFSPITDVQPFPLSTIKVSSSNGKITCLEWNPEVEDLFTVGTSDGTLLTIKYSLDNRLNFSIIGQAALPNYPTCLSWSRKGKQLSVGDSAGRLHQLKPELTSVRHVDAPQPIQGLTSPVQCAGIFWVDTTNWLLVYRQRDDPIRLTLTLLTVKKNRPPEWIYFGDLTFQRSDAPQTFDTSLHFVPLMDWNLVFIFAHRSSDFALVGQRNGNWITFVTEKYNVSMPMNSRRSCTYPIGAAVDFTSSNNIVSEHGNVGAVTLPPQPILHVLSSGGLLLPYHICSLDKTRPRLAVNPITFSAQNVMNGPQPPSYQPRPQVEQTPIAAVSQQQPLFAPKLPAMPPQTSINQQTVQVAVRQQQQTIPKQDSGAIQADFERVLGDYSATKIQLIKELEALSALREMLSDRSDNFDTECVDSLWELFAKVQHSLDNGIQSIDTTSRKTSNLIGHLKQAESVWQKYLMASDQRKRNIGSSSILEDLHSADRRFRQLQEKSNQTRTTAEEVLALCDKKDSLDSPFRSKSLDPIPSTEQDRINKVNEAIGKRITQYAKRVLSLQQHMKLLKAYAKNNNRSPFESIEPTPSSTSPDMPVNSLTGDIQRLLLIVDGKVDFSPFNPKFKAQQEKPIGGQLTKRQTVLRDLMNVRSTGTVFIQRVCPKKLIVDDTPLTKSIPTRSRLSASNNELKDQRLRQQVAATKQALLQAKTTSPSVSQSGGSPGVALNHGTKIDSAAILSAINSSAETIKPPSQSIQAIKPISENASQQQPEAQTPKVQPLTPSFSSMVKPAAEKSDQPKSAEVKKGPDAAPPSFSFGPKTETINEEASKYKTPSGFPPEPKKDDATNQQRHQAAASNMSDFSFGQQNKDENDLSSAFKDFSATGQQPSNGSNQQQTPISFSFSPSKAADSSKPQSFSFGSQQQASNAGSSVFGNISMQQSNNNAQQSQNQVAFSFAPKFGQPSGFGNNQTGSTFGSGGFSAFSQNKSDAFGQPSQSAFGQLQASQQGPFGTSTKPSSGFGGFGSGPSFGSTAFGGKPSTFGSTESNTVPSGGSGFSAFASGTGGFSAFANKGSSFGQLAQQSQQQASPFGSGFGSPSGSAFGTGSAFGSPQQNNTSSAFTAFRK